jgi:hypothetical protein
VCRNAMIVLALLLPTGAAGVAEDNWAAKMFETTSHDFGTVARGAKAEFRFKLTNIYQEEVHIADVRTSCTCTSPTISQKTLKTYEEAAIVAAFNTRSTQFGQRKATLTVTFDKPFFSEVQLQVSGYIRSDIVVEPGAAEFGSVDAAEPAERQLKISYRGRADWAITEIRSSSDFIEAEAVEGQRVGDLVTYDMTVRLLAGAPAGYLKEELTLVTNDARQAEVPVAIEGHITTGLTVNPLSLFLGALKPGQRVTKNLLVQAKRPFHVTGLDIGGDDSSFEFKLPEAEKKVHVIPLTFTASDVAGRSNYKIRITTDLGGGTSAEVPASAQVVEVPSTGAAE